MNMKKKQCKLRETFSQINVSEKNQKLIIQFVKFGIVGVSNTAVSYISNILVLWALASFGVSWDYILANLVAFVIGVLWSFYWNNRYVFKANYTNKQDVLTALLKMAASYAFTGIVLNNILSILMIEVLHISKYLVPLINSLIGVPVNFVLNKLWTFRNK